ncbi:DMT family transporter [Catenovulum sediminis]|uniref:DMT family transporter n=1 Tax=Catenovulum sediminis TaxID=1740262 RepID=A0ABV1RKM2_9ALTE
MIIFSYIRKNKNNHLCWLLFAVLAFAGNSVVCRLALYSEHIDPISFTSLRLSSGAVVLFLLAYFKQAHSHLDDNVIKPKHWFSTACLCLYAFLFAYAYLQLPSGTGALILFASVQLTLLLFSFLAGQKFARNEWIGMGLATTGMLLVTLPNSQSADLGYVFLMALAGIAWGGYTLVGRASQTPIFDSKVSFILSVPVAMGVFAMVMLLTDSVSWQPIGIGYALISGVLCSGLGYYVWYKVLPTISASQTIAAQLSVPVVAAIGGLLFIGEPITLLFILACAFVSAGVYLVFLRI